LIIACTSYNDLQLVGSAGGGDVILLTNLIRFLIESLIKFILFVFYNLYAEIKFSKSGVPELLNCAVKLSIFLV
jgi:hypothetical protein